MTAAEIRAQVVASRRAQGLTDHLTDPALLAELAAAVGGTRVEKGDAAA